MLQLLLAPEFTDGALAELLNSAESPHVEYSNVCFYISIKLKWTPKSGHLLAKLSYAARCAPVVKPPAWIVKFGAGGGSILGSWSGGRSTARSVAQGRAQPAAEASQNRGRMGGISVLGWLRQAALSPPPASASVAATLRS